MTPPADDPPRHIVATAADADAAVHRLARIGWRVRAGFSLPAADTAETHLVVYGPVADRRALHLAVHAAIRGAGVVAIADPATGIGRALHEQLTRLGPVTHGPTGTVAGLVPEQTALLDRLAAGDTIAAAAAAEYLSLRTANRRIAEARAVLGVRTTREAVLVYLRQRDLPHPR